jgi:predicted CoA-binding protein
MGTGVHNRRQGQDGGMAQADPRTVLESAQTVAVVGCSTNPAKAAHRIPSWLQAAGFTVWPVNPTAVKAEILGQPVVGSLADLTEPPDLVVVFRPSDEAADVTRQAIAAGAGAVWLQLGITSTEAQRLAADAGIPFIQDRCTGVDAHAFGIRKQAA